MRHLLLLLCVLTSGIATAPAYAGNIAFSGVILDQGENPLLSRFATWLSRQVDGAWLPVYQDSYRGLSDYLREHEHALGWTGGAPFVEDHEMDGQQLVAVPLFHHAPTYYSLVMARAERGEKSLSAFRGKVFAYSDPRSNSGYLAPAFALREQGIDIRRHFSYLLRTGVHENTIEALLGGLADVGNVDEYVWVEFLKHHPDAGSKLKIVERFGPFPFTPIVAAKAVPKAVIARLQQALTHMQGDAEGHRILDELGLDGFVVKTPAFFDPIKAMQQRVGKPLP